MCLRLVLGPCSCFCLVMGEICIILKTHKIIRAVGVAALVYLNRSKSPLANYHYQTY